MIQTQAQEQTQWSYGAATHQPLLPDEDLAYTILADLKRVTREYATAAMEAVCPSVRTMFTQMMNNNLRVQGELFNAMQQQNMYNASSPAPRHEIDKQWSSYSQTQQKTAQFLHHKQSMLQQGAAPSPQMMPQITPQMTPHMPPHMIPHIQPVQHTQHTQPMQHTQHTQPTQPMQPPQGQHAHSGSAYSI